MIATSPCVRTQMMHTHACPDIRSYFEMANPKFICVKGYASRSDQLGISDFSPSHPHSRRSLIDMVWFIYQTKQGELEIVTKKGRLQLATGNAYSQETKTRVEGHLRTLSVVKEKQGYFRRTYPIQANPESRHLAGLAKKHMKCLDWDMVTTRISSSSSFKTIGSGLQEVVNDRAQGRSNVNHKASNKAIFQGLFLSLDFFGRPVTGLAIIQPFREYQRELVSVGLYQKGSWCGKPRSGSSSAIRWSNPFVVDPIAASWHIVSTGSLVVYCGWFRIPPAGGQGPFRPVIEEHFAVPSPSLQMMIHIPRSIPLLTKQILSIKSYSALSTPIMWKIPKPESCASMTAARTNRGAFLYKSKIWVVSPSLKAKSISKKGSNAKFQQQIPKEKPKTKSEAYTKSSSPKGSKEIQIRGLY
ncbi:hypothetical protein PHYBLDRAFT_145826 [Phycomyces blakesleeanus NRRL 1555(-)]|uniref:Uncharacterized protein n=1 Tax=Phycomyces blakesleeanus (strain ATCC 8743b / DSM 1359 / FGSC 10004 / NBRC 33097 / NRRL 1555) TaxID=763407 RepID=A0A167MPB0_PHYB8|nr:hypothetical protein PHYBLDRAFT_145826 [Phycomyces blakesleeanus NRRL 1555(-)]OAD73436.1 hypothetical protein PHYBLDRAFT_145826 [Phycomyces blakesleeanus NRRL 1555(-)]|eukprot:XP_018291476.1 hypothetical protein PHYBLDRAFT_145826 [Phycomyces blakesleeanus NRRL 1555(-)]